MKKFLIMIVILLGIAGVLSAIVALRPNLSRRCSLGDFGVSVAIPYKYEPIKTTEDNKLLNLYDASTGISIQAMNAGEQFWQEETIAIRIEEYVQYLSAANYDYKVSTTKQEEKEVEGGTVGVIEIEIDRNTEVGKSFTVITGGTGKNIILEMYGKKETMEANREEFETIIGSIKIEEKK